MVEGHARAAEEAPLINPIFHDLGVHTLISLTLSFHINHHVGITNRIPIEKRIGEIVSFP